MRRTAALTLFFGAVLVASKSTHKSIIGGKDPAYDGIIYAPPVTATITETETITEYDTITDFETTITATHTAYEVASPVTATVTEYADNVYDQSYGNDYWLGDFVVAPTAVTETKTFTLMSREGGEEKTSTTKLVNVWSIEKPIEYATTITEYTSTTWVNVHATSTVWVEPNVKPTKASKPEDVDSSEASDDEFDEPNAENYEDNLEEVWQEQQGIHDAISGDDNGSNKGKQEGAPSSSASRAHKLSPLHGPTPTHRPSSPFHRPTSSRVHSTHKTSSYKPSTFEIKTSLSDKPTSSHKPEYSQASVSNGHWQGMLRNTTNGTCGPKGGRLAWSCHGNKEGTCCSPYGHCGSSPAHCGEGCQSAYGTCDKPADKHTSRHPSYRLGSDNGGKHQPSHHGVAKREGWTSKETEDALLAFLALTLLVQETPPGMLAHGKVGPSFPHLPDNHKTRRAEHKDGNELDVAQDPMFWFALVASMIKGQEDAHGNFEFRLPSGIRERGEESGYADVDRIWVIVEGFHEKHITHGPYNMTELLVTVNKYLHGDAASSNSTIAVNNTAPTQNQQRDCDLVCQLQGLFSGKHKDDSDDTPYLPARHEPMQTCEEVHHGVWHWIECKSLPPKEKRDDCDILSKGEALPAYCPRTKVICGVQLQEGKPDWIECREENIAYPQKTGEGIQEREDYEYETVCDSYEDALQVFELKNSEGWGLPPNCHYAKKEKLEERGF